MRRLTATLLLGIPLAALAVGLAGACRKQTPPPTPSAPPPPKVFDAKEEEVGRIDVTPGRAKVEAVTPDGCHYAYVAKQADKVAVVVDAKVRKEYPAGAEIDDLHIGPDGGRVAYVLGKEGGKCAVVDGKEGPTFTRIDGLMLSPDGKRFAYVGVNVAIEEITLRKSEAHRLFLDGAGVEVGSLKWMAFTPDNRFARVALDSRNAEALLVGDQTFTFTLGPRRQATVEVGTEPGEHPVFTPDGKHVACCLGTAVAVDEKVGPDYGRVANRIRLSDNGEHVAYLATPPNAQRFVVHDGRPDPAHASPHEYVTGDFTLSANGEHAAFTAGKRPEMNFTDHVVVDGKAGPEFAYVRPGSLALSPDGKRIAYVIHQTDQRHRAVIDHKPGPAYVEVASPRPIFSPDGSRVAYIAARTHKQFPVLDGREGLRCDEIRPASLQFSPDGKHLVFVARKGAAHVVVQAGNPGPEFDLILPNGPTWRDGGILEYVACRGSTLYRVRHVPK